MTCGGVGKRVYVGVDGGICVVDGWMGGYMCGVCWCGWEGICRRTHGYCIGIHWAHHHTHTITPTPHNHNTTCYGGPLLHQPPPPPVSAPPASPPTTSLPISPVRPPPPPLVCTTYPPTPDTVFLHEKATMCGSLWTSADRAVCLCLVG